MERFLRAKPSIMYFSSFHPVKWGPCISDSQMRKPSSAKNTSRAQGHKASKGWSPGFHGSVPGSTQSPTPAVFCVVWNSDGFWPLLSLTYYQKTTSFPSPSPSPAVGCRYSSKGTWTVGWGLQNAFVFLEKRGSEATSTLFFVCRL